MGADYHKVQVLVHALLEALGEDRDREGLVKTPLRVARFWQEFLEYDPGNVETQFESIETDQMVIVKGIAGWSMCEHHLLPFSFVAHVGYITGDRVIGLSKIPRIVQKHAHALQLQERLTAQIADELERIAKPRGIGVLIEGVHTCVVMRGIRSPGVTMTTSCMRGIMLGNPYAKDEFLRLVLR